MSAPAQNSIGFAEANDERADVPADTAASQASRSAAPSSGEIEFAGGRASQAIATSPRVSSWTGRSAQPSVAGYG